MKNRLAFSLMVLGTSVGTAGSAALGQGLHPISDVRTVDATSAADTSERDARIVVEVPTLDRLMPFQRFVINPYERQDDPARFEIRVDGTIRNYARVTNGFVRGQRYVAERLEEARLAWLREHAGVASHAGDKAQGERAAVVPRATITMPEGASGGGGFRVQAPTSDRARLVAALERMKAHEASVRAAARPAAEPTNEATEPKAETTVASAG